jgi:hypothetical protein
MPQLWMQSPRGDSPPCRAPSSCALGAGSGAGMRSQVLRQTQDNEEIIGRVAALELWS